MLSSAGDIRSLLVWIKKNLLKEQSGQSCSSLQSGVLVLINDAYWELLNYQLQNQDSILFISMLHSG